MLGEYIEIKEVTVRVWSIRGQGKNLVVETHDEEDIGKMRG